MELGRIPFRYRVFAGLGFFVVGLAGVAGTFAECGGALASNAAAWQAEMHHNKAALDRHNTEHTRHQEGAVVDVLSGAFSLYMSQKLMRGAYRRFMRVDGTWAEGAFAVKPAAIEAAPASDAQPAANGAAILTLVTAETSPATDTGNVVAIDFGAAERAS